MAKKTSKNKFNTDLFKVLKQAVQQSNRKATKVVNVDYQAVLKKASSASKRRQAEKSAIGRAKTVNAGQQIKKARIPKIKPKTVKAAPSITSVTHRTRAQYLEEAKAGFVSRFVERLNAAYNDWKKEWNADIIKILRGMGAQQLDDMMNMINLDKMYYESDSYSVNTGATGKALYEYFMQFKTE